MSDSRVVATIEARMNSSRLPGKVMLDICGKPAIARQVERMQQAQRLDAIVLATTTNPSDDALADWGAEAGIPVYRGSEDDVLGRVVGALETNKADIAVPLCGDCPLIDPEIIDLSVTAFRDEDVDFVTNSVVPGVPQGQDVQVTLARHLADIAGDVDDPAVHEHTCLFLHEHPERFRTHHLAAPDRWRAPEVRTQMDYREDLELIRAVYDELLPVHGDAFGIADVLGLLEARPDIATLNAGQIERAPRAEHA